MPPANWIYERRVLKGGYRWSAFKDGVCVWRRDMMPNEQYMVPVGDGILGPFPADRVVIRDHGESDEQQPP